MIHGKRIVVVMPAYNAEKTLQAVCEDIPAGFVDEIILVDDASQDQTAALARELGIQTIVHDENQGYGANQKTCYRAALEAGADVIIMLHPDYQYTPKLVPAMASLVALGQYDVVLGSRILSGGALIGGMPRYKYIANRVLTGLENLVTGAKLSEYHTGYRAFSREVLLTLPLQNNSNDFVFDNQVLVQVLHFGYRIGEITCPARYFPEASSINFRRSLVYGLGVIKTMLQYRFESWGLAHYRLFTPTHWLPESARHRIPLADRASVARFRWWRRLLPHGR